MQEENKILKNSSCTKLKNKKAQLLTTLIFVTVMTVATLITCLPAATANVIATTNMETTAYLAFRPNPIGMGQQLLVNVWVTPTPVTDTDLGLVPPGTFGSGIPRQNYNVYFTKPDGTVVKFENITSYGDGSAWFTYTPDQVGTWTVQFNWTGVDLKGAPGATVAEASYLPCTTDKLPLVVQSDPIASYPAAALPTDSWTWPINPDNREWTYIAGAWFYQRYDATQSSFNPYTQAPESSHILWMDSSGNLAGLVGQPYGAISSFSVSGSYPTVSTVMLGRGYYTTGGGFFGPTGPQTITCLDIRTGEQLWTISGTFGGGTIEVSGSTYTPVLYDIGARFIKYDALTGAVLLNETGVENAMTGMMGSGFINYPYAVVKQHLGSDLHTGYFMVKLWLNGTATDISQRVAWNVSMDSFHHTQNSGDFKIVINNGIILYAQYATYADTGAFNATTGEILWHRPQDSPYGIEMGVGGVTTGNGCFYFGCEDRHEVAYNLTTGEQVWLSPQTEYPWGDFWAYTTDAAYGNIYGFGYAGIYSFNATTGAINWHFKVNDTYGETPYGTWPFHGMSQLIADGKVYAANCEHSPTMYYRGDKMYCLDAHTGDEIWDISGYYTPSAIAEGTLFATNAYDGSMYAFAKGETATTVATQNDVYAKGSTVLIKGTVLDQSPAQPNTPAIADASMTAWMEYLHMQKPKPTNATGVQVTLTAVDANGKQTTIGTVTSDASGNYAFAWAPQTEGTYTIVASFGGSKSYYASSAETSVAVTSVTGVSSASPQPSTPETSTSPSVLTSVSPNAPVSGSPGVSPTQAPPSNEPQPTNIYIAIVAAVIIIAIAAAAIVLRKRKK
jgi:outer membrane protein assembly factor BamB